MSSEERLERLGVAHLSGAALERELAARVKAHQDSVDAWRKSLKMSGEKSATKPTGVSSKTVAGAAASPTPPGPSPELKGRAEAAFDEAAAALFLKAIAETARGSLSEQALLATLAQAEHKNTTIDQALTRIEQFEAARTRPTPRKP